MPRTARLDATEHRSSEDGNQLCVEEKSYLELLQRGMSRQMASLCLGDYSGSRPCAAEGLGCSVTLLRVR